MSVWRREALERVPQLTEEIERAEDFAALCRLMAEQVWEAYGRADILGESVHHSPEDDTLLQGIHDWAGDCLLHPPDSDAYTNVVLFYESLSENINVYVAREFYKYVAPEVLAAMRNSGLLTYILDRDSADEFLADYWAKRQPPTRKSRGGAYGRL